METIESESHSDISILGRCPRLKNQVKIFEPIFLYLGVFAQNVPFIKDNSFGESFF